jgi:hypothetical protein
MGRKPLLARLSQNIGLPNNRDKNWLVSYSFQSKPNPQLYRIIDEHIENLRKSKAKIERPRTGNILTNDLHGALIFGKVLKHYKADVNLYSIDEYYPNIDIDTEYVFTLKPDEVLSVMKAVYAELKQITETYVQDYYTYHLTCFLCINNTFHNPRYPMNKDELDIILEHYSYLENNDTSGDADYKNISHGIRFRYEIVIIMKAVENYIKTLQEHTKDIDILSEIHKRFLKSIEEVDVEDMLIRDRINSELM